MTSPAPPTAVTRRSQLMVGLFISFCTVLMCLCPLEWVAYRWEQKTAQEHDGWTLVASRRMPLVEHGTEAEPYFLFEPQAHYNWEGIDVQIDSRGLRTPEFAIPKPANTFRILNIGDSVAFGWEVTEQQTYGEQLAASLNALNDGRHYEVINAAVPGWNPAMERNFLLQEGLSYEPDLIIVDLTLANDIYGKGPGVTSRPSFFNFLRDKTYTWPFLTTEIRFIAAKQVGPKAIPVLNPSLKVEKYFPLDENAPIWDTVWQNFADMAQAAQERGIPLVVISFPTAFQLNSVGHPDTPQKVFGAKAEADGIAWLDMLPIYQAVCAEAAAEACEGYENILFADVWMHPNMEGHRLAAEALLAWWLENRNEK